MAELQIAKKNIGSFLTEIKDKKFVIPDYQRPYAWDEEKCYILWSDIVDAYEANPEQDYFLGTIVSYKNSNEDIEIIDGQQRITTLLLLLRAFYQKIEKIDEGVGGLKSSIESFIWKINAKTGKIVNTNNIHLESKVATDEEKQILIEIIKKGEAENKKNKYWKNYDFFLKKSNKYAEKNPFDDRWENLCLFVIEHCIILPIQCDEEETAFTIFQTLNDRGLPLSNSDIFKAKIYQSKPEEERDKFIEGWSDLVEICKEAYVSVDDIFRYYSHILRAKAGDTKKEVALRTFYSNKRYKKLKEEHLIEDLIELAKFWRYINNTEKDNSEDNNDKVKNSVQKARKWFHCLAHYPNDFWKYITSVFFYYRHKDNNFEQLLGLFIQDIVRFMFLKFIIYPYVNAIKDDTYKACVAIASNKENVLKEKITVEDLRQRLQFPPGRIVRALLLLHMYLDDEQDIMDTKLHVEHILPKKWQDANYRGWNRKDANEYLERFGNKVMCESKINIQAGNEYFKRKCEVHYQKSNISVVKKLASLGKVDWGIQEIEEREEQVTKDIMQFFNPILK